MNLSKHAPPGARTAPNATTPNAMRPPEVLTRPVSIVPYIAFSKDAFPNSGARRAAPAGPFNEPATAGSASLA
ncbi:hypothetical protein ACTZWT_17645 [Rhodopseudomonas sp. NSM]